MNENAAALHVAATRKSSSVISHYSNQPMKFCKNLQRVVDISDPEWSPYWVNYKMLKVRPSRKTQWIDLMKIRVISPSLVRTNLRFL